MNRPEIITNKERNDFIFFITPYKPQIKLVNPINKSTRATG